MNLIRLIVIALAVWLLIKLAKQLFSAKPLPQKKPKAEVASMIKCDHCGLHIPEQEAVRGDRGQYCSEAHKHLAEGD